MMFEILMILVCFAIPLFILILWSIQQFERKAIQHWLNTTNQWQKHFNTLNLQLNVKVLAAGYYSLGLMSLFYCFCIIHEVLFGVILLVLLIIAPKIIFKLLNKKRISHFEQLLPEALGQIAGSLRSGASLINAIDLYIEDTSGPVSEELSLFIKEYRFGIPLLEALDLLSQRVKNENLTLVVSTTRISTELGGNLAETYERLGATLQQKLMLEKKIDAFTSQGKLQGWVVGALPFGLMAVLHSIEPQAMGLIFTTWLGWGILGFVVVLEFLGITFIKKIVNIDV